jgi:hypothetical protein
MQVLRQLRDGDRPVVAISRMDELGPRAMVPGAHAFLEKQDRDVDDLLDMTRAAYRHDPWSPGG